MHELQEEIDRVTRLKAAEEAMAPLGLCADCPRVATVPCPDDFARCQEHAALLARQILLKASRFHDRLSAHGKKQRAKRRKARKLAKR